MSPLREKFGLAQVGIYALVLFGAFQLGGWNGVAGALATKVALVRTALYTIPVFITANLITAPFKALTEAKKDGRWHCDEFIQNSRTLIHSRRIQVVDHASAISFKVPGVPGGAYISYEIEFHPPNQYWSGCLSFPLAKCDPAMRGIRMGGTGGIRLTKDGSTALMVWSARDDVASAIVRVWLHSWHAGEIPL